MAKSRHIKIILIVIFLLAAFHIGVGFYLSPAITPFLIERINQRSPVKIYLEKANIWPLSLSCTLKGLKIPDPKDERNYVIFVEDASVYLSFIGLFSKQFILSGVHMNAVQISLAAEPDGTFNIQRLMGEKQGKEEPGPALEAHKEKKDVFGMVYRQIKIKPSQQEREKNKPRPQEIKESGKYLLRVKNLTVNNGLINVRSAQGQSVQIAKATLRLNGFCFDPQNRVRLTGLHISGDIEKKGLPAGKLVLSYAKDGSKIGINGRLAEVDLSAVGFIYEDSLPLELPHGILNLESKTAIVDNKLDSQNKLILRGHKFLPKPQKEEQKTGFMPADILCEALNNIDPLKLDFKVGGTLDKPEFKDLEKIISELLKPYFKKVIVNKAGEIIGEALEKKPGEKTTPADIAVGVLKTILKGKE